MNSPSQPTLSDLILLPDTVRQITIELDALKAEIESIKHTSSEGWMPIAQAAKALGKSVSAVRQRLRRTDKPMPQGKVWEQDGKGCGIKVHLGNYRRFM